MSATVTDTAGAQNAIQTVLMDSDVAVNGGSGYTVSVTRIATDGGDTLANDAGVVAVKLERVT